MSVFGSILKLVAIGAFFVAATFPGIGPVAIGALRIGGIILGYLGAMIDRPKTVLERQTYDMDLNPGTPIPVVYGRAKVPGIVADWFVDPDTTDKILYMAVPFAHGSRDGLGIDSVEEIWFSGRKGVTVTGDVRVHPYHAVSTDYQLLLGTTTQNAGATTLSGLFAAVDDKAFANVTDRGWSATTDTGKGVALGMFRFLNVVTGGVTEGGGVDPDPDARGPTFRGPPNISFIVNGNRIYDPRTDVWTPGGDNPAMCIRDYLLAPIYGCGFSPSLIHEASFAAAADYCDALVDYPAALGGQPRAIASSSAATEAVTTDAPHFFSTGYRVRIAGHTGSTPSLNGDHDITYTGASTFTLDDVSDITVGGTGGTAVRLVPSKRFTCNGVVDTSRPTADNIQELLSSCRGNLVWEQGKFKLTIRHEGVAAPTVTLNPSNILGEWSFRNAGQEEKWNVVKASYIEPANGEFKAQEVQWPVHGTTNAYLTADNNFTNTLELSLPFTNDQMIAQAICQVTLNEARLGITAQCRCTEEALALSVGDKVKVTHPTPGWTDKLFWVTALQLLPDTSVSVSLQEYDATAYDLTTMEDRRTYPATTHESIFDVEPPGAVTAVGISGGGLAVTWVRASYGLIDFYEVQAKCTSCGDPYTTIARVRDGGTREAIAPLARPGQTWHARVRVINQIGWPSAWVTSSSTAIPSVSGITPGTGSLVLTGYAPTVTATVSPPDLVSVNRVTLADSGDKCGPNPLKNWQQTVSWTTTGADDANYYTRIEVATNSAGTNYVGLVIELTTASSSYLNNTGVSGHLTDGSPTTYYRKYKVMIIRRSDLVTIESMETSQATITLYDGSCFL